MIYYRTFIASPSHC